MDTKASKEEEATTEFSKFDLDDDVTDSSDSQTASTSETRDTWSSQLDFVMTSVGCAVGLGNIWRFPYLCYKNGGGAFFIPYLLSFVFAATPGYLLEISLGQYSSSGVVRAWDIIPLFSGLGAASVVIMCWSSIYYIVVIAWALYYVGVSFSSQLPWGTCDNPWNTDRCFVTGMSLNRSTTICMTSNDSDVTNNTRANGTDCITTPNDMTSLPPVDSVVEYWEKQVLQMSSGIEEPGSAVPGLTLALFVAWVLVYFCIFRGVKWTGKIVYFTALAPYVLLLTIFIRGITLEGAVDGLIYFLKPDFTRLGDAQVWMDGGTQVIYSIGLGQGFMICLGSYNKFNHKCIRNGSIIMVINCLTSVFGGLAVFSVLGFMAHETQQPIDKVVSSGPGLVFLTYPKAVLQMPLPHLWSVLFFCTIVLVGLDSQFAMIEAFTTLIADRFPRILYRPGPKMLMIAVFCFVCFLLGIPLVTEGGVYVFRLIDYYSVSGLVLLFMVFFQAFSIAWVYGAERYYDCLELMLGYRPTAWLKISWKYTTPLIINGIFWFQVATYKPLKFDDRYTYPAWATVCGFFMMLSSVGWVPGMAIYRFIRANGTTKERWRELTTQKLKKHMLYPSWTSNSNYRWRQVKYGSYDVNNPYNMQLEINT